MGMHKCVKKLFCCSYLVLKRTRVLTFSKIYQKKEERILLLFATWVSTDFKCHLKVETAFDATQFKWWPLYQYILLFVRQPIFRQNSCPLHYHKCIMNPDHLIRVGMNIKDAPCVLFRTELVRILIGQTRCINSKVGLMQKMRTPFGKVCSLLFTSLIMHKHVAI